MKFDNVKYYKSVSLGMKEIHFERNKEIVFVGRSNAGKSSLLNAIFGKKDLVKTSSKPGKTRLANIFLVNNKYYFTDLPGYGFAKLGKNLQEDLDGLISWYLEERKEEIKKVVLLIDSKLGAQEVDIEMYNYVLELNLPIVVVLPKIDKITNMQLNKIYEKSKETFYGQEIVKVSSITKDGIKELSSLINKSLL